MGLFELLHVTDPLRDAVSRHASRSELRDVAREGGMISLRQDGWHKVIEGKTTIEEVLRVTEA